MNSRNWIHMVAGIGLLAAQHTGIADEPQRVVSRIESISMFKNGLALVHRTLEVPGSGRYLLDRLPEPVHGTFWLESRGQVTARTTMMEVEVPPGQGAGIHLQEDLAGREVTVFFDNGDIPSVTGRVTEPEPESDETTWSRDYERHFRHWNRYMSGSAPKTEAGRFLLIESESGLSYIDRQRIAYIQAAPSERQLMRKRPVLILDVDAGRRNPVTIRISYLTKGIAWAPSYRVDISDDQQLRLTQKAVVKNELEDFEDSSLYLISGYPSIQFSHVTSPMSPSTNWADFFQNLNREPGSGGRSPVLTQQRVMMNTVAPDAGMDLAAVPQGEGVDLDYRDIGPQSMRAGDALTLEVASGEAEYERLVEWRIPDNRKPDGRYIEEYQRNRDPEKFDDTPWDAVRFKNPFEFPMTTAAAIVVDEGRFNGQHTSTWVNSGEHATLYITQALSVRTRHVESEVDDERNRETVQVGGRRFRKVRVKGEIFVNNHRKENVSMIVRRNFSGELVSAQGFPETRLLESGVYSVNKRNELVWEMSLRPGQELKRSYTYDVLVAH